MPDEPIDNASDGTENQPEDSASGTPPEGASPDQPVSPEPPPPTDDAAGGAEDFSQADIDAALAAASAPETPATPEEPPADAADSAPLLSQADIDAALSGESPQEASPPADAPDAGELSQADIDAALNAASEPDASAPAEEAPSAHVSGETGFSQADIDAALQGLESAAQQAPGDTPPPDPAGGASAQSDIDAMLADAAAVAEPQLDSAGRPMDDEAAAMAAAVAAEAAEAAEAAQKADDTAAQTTPVELPDFSQPTAAAESSDISILRDVNLNVHIELGRTKMYIEDILRLGEGSVVELDNLAGDPVDVYVNGRLVARGEVLVLSDNFCVRVSEIVQGLQDVSAA
jgi:flagellar motor switch protein FliN